MSNTKQVRKRLRDDMARCGELETMKAFREKLNASLVSWESDQMSAYKVAGEWQLKERADGRTEPR